MLVLNRRPWIGGAGDESKIVLTAGGSTIEITLCETRPNGTARIGIDAPRDVNIIRKELIPKPESAKVG